jgi:hypothetical protein
MEAIKNMAAYLAVLRDLPSDVPTDLPVQQLRRILAERQGRKQNSEEPCTPDSAR